MEKRQLLSVTYSTSNENQAASTATMPWWTLKPLHLICLLQKTNSYAYERRDSNHQLKQIYLGWHFLDGRYARLPSLSRQQSQDIYVTTSNNIMTFLQTCMRNLPICRANKAIKVTSSPINREPIKKTLAIGADGVNTVRTYRKLKSHTFILREWEYQQMRQWICRKYEIASSKQA